MLLFGIVIGFFINANKFSLHATYRNRLIRAYLAASRTMRSPNLFTGFDPEDNIKLARPGCRKASSRTQRLAEYRQGPATGVAAAKG